MRPLARCDSFSPKPVCGAAISHTVRDMKLRNSIAALVLTTSALTGAGIAVTAETASAATCTKTSTGKCIKAGQFCPQAKFKKSGIDAKGRKLLCKGDKIHPRWK